MAWLEDPAILAGVPLLLLGLLGAFIALGAMFAPAAPEAAAGQTLALRRPPGAHPSPGEYINIGLILGLITAVEVGIYYVNLGSLFVPALLLLSAVKFILVVAFFMHLRFDNRLFTTFFAGAFFLTAALFTVVMVSLNAGLR